MSDKLVLIDGHSILNRAFYGVPDLTNSEGLHTNAIYGFLNIMFKILEEEKAQYLTVAFDLKAPTFRHEMFKEYKGTRKSMPEELREQVPIIKDVLKAMGILIVEKEGFEADDLLGTIAKNMEKEGLLVSVVSGDRDLLQLATDKIKIRIPKTKRTGTEIEDYNEKEVIEKYQVTPQQIIELKALMGDTADNIPGLPGIGEKTATKLIVEYGSIENAYSHVEEVKPNKARESMRDHFDLAELSKALATIKIDCPIEYSLEDARIGNLYTEEAYEFFQELEFKNFLHRFEQVGAKPIEVEKYFKKITMLDEAERIFAKAKEQNAVGFSIIGEKNSMFGLALAYSKEAVYFLVPEGFLTQEYLITSLEDVISTVKRTSTLDLKYALRFIKVEDISHVFDSGIAAYLVNPLKDQYSYDDIAKEYLGMLLPSRAELIGKHLNEKAMEENEEGFTKVVCYMAYTALASRDLQEAKLEELKMIDLFREIEMPLIFTIHDMEEAGILVEADALKVYGDQLSVRIVELEKEIYSMAGEEFNINSPKQLGVILFEKLQLPNGKKTKTGFSTAADVLEKLAAEYPIVSLILEYRQLTKLKSTYADGLANYIGEDHRIHTSFNQTITATGRISSTEPNLQNIPIRMELGRLIRKVFIPKEGYVFLDADYSQIELRVLAHLSEDKILINAYKEAQDIHRMTASQVFHTPFDEVTDLQRRNAKAVNFGIVYGISSFGLSQDLSITRKEAAEYIEKYFATYPKVKSFLDETVEQAKKDGYVTTMFGRRRPVPELKSSNFMQRSFGERIAMNSPIQGTAADIMKIAMIRVNDRLKTGQLKSRLILTVHDELLVETCEDEVEIVKEILDKEMHEAANLEVPLEIDLHTGHNWYEAK
jgi:DNA polymerase-1